jgi:hypothetical protein
MSLIDRDVWPVLPRAVPGAKGDLWTRDTNGNLVAVTFPVGATLGSHVLVTGGSGLPVWMARAAFAELLGAGAGAYAWLYMTTIDETGATVLATDDDGNPILTYAPVS